MNPPFQETFRYMAKTTIVEYGQNALDVLIQCYGNLKYLFRFLKDNSISLNENLPVGKELYFDELPENTPEREVQDFYQRRNIRVKTGEEAYTPSPSCPIPEGYVMWQFRFKATWSNPRIHITTGTCPTPATIQTWTASEQAENIAFWAQPVPLNSLEANAHYFVQWFNAYKGDIGYAIASYSTVSIFLKKDLYPCGTKVWVCAYTINTSNNLVAVPTPDYIQYKADGDTLCCATLDPNEPVFFILDDPQI